LYADYFTPKEEKKYINYNNVLEMIISPLNLTEKYSIILIS